MEESRDRLHSGRDGQEGQDGLKRGVFVEPYESDSGRPAIRAVVWDDFGMKRDLDHLFDNLDDALTFARSFCPKQRARESHG